MSNLIPSPVDSSEFKEEKLMVLSNLSEDQLLSLVVLQES
jgi:hypothetical protein